MFLESTGLMKQKYEGCFRCDIVVTSRQSSFYKVKVEFCKRLSNEFWRVGRRRRDAAGWMSAHRQWRCD